MYCIIGSVCITPLTHMLSFQLLETNAKSKNLGRTLILLNLKKAWIILPYIFHILLISGMDDPSLGVALRLIRQFTADYTIQGK